MSQPKLDWVALVCAALIETALAALIPFGGPHGAFGAWPWALQLPGIFLLWFGAEPGGVFLRVALVWLVQATLWYLLISAIRRRRRAKLQV